MSGDGGIQARLVEAAPRLLEALDVSEKLLRCMERSDAMNTYTRKTITSQKYDEIERVGQLLDHVKRDTVRRYPALVSALRETQQYHALTVLGEAAEVRAGGGGGEEMIQDTTLNVSEAALATKMLVNIKKSKSKLKSMDLSELKLLLTDYNVLTDDQVDSVWSKPEKVDKIHDLFVVKLPSRPQRAVLLFGRVLLESDQGHFLDHLGVTAEEKLYLKQFTEYRE